jgi:hypothetical protein
MNADNHLWGFTSLVPEERRRRLLAVQSYDEVIEGIACGEVDYFNVESWHECSRAIFKLQVEDAVFDAFFNSPAAKPVRKGRVDPPDVFADPPPA